MIEDYDLLQARIAHAWSLIRAGELPEALNCLKSSVDNYIAEDATHCDEILNVTASIYEGMADLERAAYYYSLYHEKILQRVELDPGDSDHYITLCMSYMGMGRISVRLSGINEAIAYYTQMYTLSSGLLVEMPGDTAIMKLKMIACEDLADLYIRQDRPADAFSFCEQFGELTAKIHDILPDEIDIRCKMSYAHLLLGDYYTRIDELTVALEYCIKACTIAKELSDNFNGSAEFNSQYAICNERLGTIYFNLAENDKALEYFETCLLLNEMLVEDNPENIVFRYNRITAIQSLGILYHRKLDFTRALSYFDKCFIIVTEMIHENPGYADMKRMLGVIYQYRAIIYEDQDQLEEAKANYMAMFNCFRELTLLFPGNPLFIDNLAYASCRLGVYFQDRAKKADAVMYFTIAKNIWTQLKEEYSMVEEYKQKAVQAEMLLKEI